jgi:putative PIN family toxin of toxin-antitoxin system
MKNKNIRVIFDTNVWISFLIGKRLSKIKKYIADRRITIVTTERLLYEIRLVTGRKKFKKYFPEESVNELLELLETIAEKIAIKAIHVVSSDSKDNFLFDLISFSKADFLVTGDKELLTHSPFESAEIVTPTEFEKELELQFGNY